MTIAPNPFSGATFIKYQVARPGPIKLSILDATGRRVRTLAQGIHRPGIYGLTWDSRDDRFRQVPRGVYFVRLVSGGHTASEKILLMR